MDEFREEPVSEENASDNDLGKDLNVELNRKLRQ